MIKTLHRKSSTIASRSGYGTRTRSSYGSGTRNQLTRGRYSVRGAIHSVRKVQGTGYRFSRYGRGKGDT